MKKILLYFVLFFVSKIVFAQPLGSPLHFTNYTIADGLPSNVVVYFMQDSRGFIWLCSTQGLTRFDGSHFTVYRHSRSDNSSMPYDNVGKCIELKNHHLLFNSSTKMWILNPFNHQQYAPPTFWKKLNYAFINYMNEHIIAILSKDKTYFTDMNLQVIDSVNNPLPGITALNYAGNNKIIFSTRHKLFCYSLGKKKMEEWKINEADFGNKDGYSITWVDTVNTRLYLSNYFTGAFIASYNDANPAYLKPQHNTDINLSGRIIVKDDNVLVSTDDVLAIFQKDKTPVIINNTLNNKNNLPGGIGELFADNKSNFWISGRNGVSRFDLKQLKYQYWKLPYAANLEFSTKYNGKIWMHSQNYGSIYFDTEIQQLKPVDSSIILYCWGATRVNDDMYIHGNSTVGKYLLPADNIKLIAYNLQTKKISTPTFLKPYYKEAELITMIFQSKNGDVWYSLNNGNGIIRQKAFTNEFKHYRSTDSPSPFSFRYVNKAAEDAAGNIYFSVNKREEILVWKKEQEHFEEWRPDSLLNIPKSGFGPLVNHLIDSKQNLWIGYGSTGLMQYNLITRKGKLFEPEDGLPSNVFENMVADAADNIWIPTAKGLVCLLSATQKFLVFSAEDGLPFTNFFESNLFFDKDDSSLYFGSTGYLFRLKTNELLARKQQNNISLYIDGVDVNNKPYYFTDTNINILKPTENNLQFNFVTLDLDNAISNKNYEYSLTKNDNAVVWQKLNGTNSIAFNQLNPGKYSLQVRILNEASNKYVLGSNSFHFTITIPWNKSWWFFTLIALGISLLVWQLIRVYYQRRIENQKQIIEKQMALVNERSRIAADMHDDMGAGLSRIRYLSTSMKNEIKDEGLKEDFDKLISGSDELVDKMNDIIWTLNSGDENLQDVLYYIRSQCSEMLDNAGIVLQTTIAENIPEKNMSSEEKRNLHLVVKEAMHNLIKHAQATIVTLNIKVENGLIIRITDNGIGFNVSESLLKGNGLGNYQKRMKILKGSVDIKSDSSGTVIEFTTPL